MPRKRRNWQPGACYHITHRCHNKQFLFRYKKYRNFYKRTLFKAVKRYRIDVLDYVITKNHVHLLVVAKEGKEISDGLRYLHGRMGQWYNKQKDNSGSFWSDRFHSTRIQSGEHLANCLVYIDLNMVRTGVVKHPQEWEHSGFKEIREGKKRCRIINRDRLLDRLMFDDFDSFNEWHESIIKEKILKDELKREKYWSESFAVGDKNWLEQLIKEQQLKRRKIIESSNNSFYLIGTQGGYTK